MPVIIKQITVILTFLFNLPCLLLQECYIFRTFTEYIAPTDVYFTWCIFVNNCLFWQLLADEFDQPKTYTTPFNGPVLLNHHDDITRRLNHLKPIDGFDARKVEMEMASFHPAANIHMMPSQETKTSKERMARLQELLSFISFSRLNQAGTSRQLM